MAETHHYIGILVSKRVWNPEMVLSELKNGRHTVQSAATKLMTTESRRSYEIIFRGIILPWVLPESGRSLPQRGKTKQRLWGLWRCRKSRPDCRRDRSAGPTNFLLRWLEFFTSLLFFNIASSFFYSHSFFFLFYLLEYLQSILVENFQ